MTKLYLEVAHSQITKMYFLKIIHLIFPQRARHCRLQNAKKKHTKKLENSQFCKPEFICPAVLKLKVQKWLFMLAWFVLALPRWRDTAWEHPQPKAKPNLGRNLGGWEDQMPTLQQSYPSRRAKRAKKAAAQASRGGWIWGFLAWSGSSADEIPAHNCWKRIYRVVLLQYLQDTFEGRELYLFIKCLQSLTRLQNHSIWKVV